jgi:hypothetical protein
MRSSTPSSSSVRGPLSRVIQFNEGPAPAARVVIEQTRQLFLKSWTDSHRIDTEKKLRERRLTLELLAILMLHYVLGSVVSLAGLVKLFARGKIPYVPAMRVSAAAFYKRLKAVPHTFFLQMLVQSTARLREQARERAWMKKLAPFASGIYAIDDTTLDALVRKTTALQQHPKGAMETLAGRLGCAIDLSTGLLAEVMYDSDAAANEKNHILPLVERLSPGAMVVFDLGYFSFPLFDTLTAAGYHFVTRWRHKTTFTVHRTLATSSLYRDQIIYLGKHRSDQAAHPARLVELCIDGTWYAYLTNVCSTKRLSAQQVWWLYQQRWTIEKTFQALKQALGMAYLRPCHLNGVLIQLWSTLTAYQTLQVLRLDIAAAAGWREDEVSWQALMQEIQWYIQDAPCETLRQRLCANPQSLGLKTQGTRQRRRKDLPPEILAELSSVLDLDTTELPKRKPRQGKAEPRGKVSITLVGGLS